MFCLLRLFACGMVCAAATGSIWPAIAGEPAFPFDREMMLDVAPIRGSKRIPILEIAESGTASIALWCASARGEAKVGTDTITIAPGPAEPAQCTPERQSGDETLLTALGQVTSWRRKGDVIELRGGKTLRFRLMSN